MTIVMCDSTKKYINDLILHMEPIEPVWAVPATPRTAGACASDVYSATRVGPHISNDCRPSEVKEEVHARAYIHGV